MMSKGGDIMFFNYEKREDLDKQILKAEEISVQEQMEKMEKKNRDNLSLVAEGLVTAGKIVKEMQEKEMAAEAQQRTTVQGSRHIDRRDEAMKRRREQPPFESRRRMRLGILLEKYFPEIKELSLDDVEAKIQGFINEKGREEVMKSTSEE